MSVASPSFWGGPGSQEPSFNSCNRAFALLTSMDYAKYSTVFYLYSKISISHPERHIYIYEPIDIDRLRMSKVKKLYR